MRRGAYVGALNRAKYCVENYDGAPAVKGSMKVMVDAYHDLNMTDLATNAEKVYADNYPGDHQGHSSPRSIGTSASCLARFVAAGDRIAPIAAEGAAAHAHARRRLAALVFVALDQIQDAPHRGSIEAARGDLIDRQILLDEGLENGIENFVRRQAVGVFLVEAQLGRRRPIDDPRGNHRATARFARRHRRYTNSLLQSLMGAKPPAMSPYSVA